MTLNPRQPFQIDHSVRPAVHNPKEKERKAYKCLPFPLETIDIDKILISKNDCRLIFCHSANRFTFRKNIV